MAPMEGRAIFNEKAVDFLLPMATKFFDMRILGHTRCSWNENFIINEETENILKKNVLFLFEILECNPMLITDKKDKKLLNRELLYPIAWSYLRPVGTANLHLSRSRLQLYRYKMSRDEKGPKGYVDHKTPDVLLEYQWPKHVKYPSFLEIELNFCNRSNNEIIRRHISRAPWEKEISK